MPRVIPLVKRCDPSKLILQYNFPKSLLHQNICMLLYFCCSNRRIFTSESFYLTTHQYTDANYLPIHRILWLVSMLIDIWYNAIHRKKIIHQFSNMSIPSYPCSHLLHHNDSGYITISVCMNKLSLYLQKRLHWQLTVCINHVELFY